MKKFHIQSTPKKRKDKKTKPGNNKHKLGINK